MPYQVDQPLKEQDVTYKIDQPLEEWVVPSLVDRIRGSYSGLERGRRFAENLDASTREDLGEPILDHTIREHISNIIQ